MGIRQLVTNLAMPVSVFVLVACSSAAPLSVTNIPTPQPLQSLTPSSRVTPNSDIRHSNVPVSTSTAIVEPATDWLEVYNQLATRYQQDTAVCSLPPVPTPHPCTRPTSYIGVTELKEHIQIEIILDASGSIVAQIDDQSKFETAKTALNRFVATFPQEAEVALRVYGHIGSNQEQDKARSCASSALVLPFTRVDPANIQRVLDTIHPSGWTPIAASLALAKDDFAAVDPANTTTLVYLISDGIETCDGDPVAEARNLHASASQVAISVIGFDVDPSAAQQLRDVAAAGMGHYYEARNVTELEHIFQDAIDWRGWSRYYYCRKERWHVYANQIQRTEDQQHRCVRDAENREYHAIRNEVTNDPRYKDVRTQVIEHAHSIRETNIDRSNQERERNIAAARAQELQQSAEGAQQEQQIPGITTTTTP